MGKVAYDRKKNAVFILFEGRMGPSEVQDLYAQLEAILPGCDEHFRIVTDLTRLKDLDFESRPVIAESMKLCNRHGVSLVIRVIKDPEQDIGLNIMSPFHYGPEVRFLTCKSMEEAESRLLESHSETA